MTQNIMTSLCHQNQTLPDLSTPEVSETPQPVNPLKLRLYDLFKCSPLLLSKTESPKTYVIGPAANVCAHLSKKVDTAHL